MIIEMQEGRRNVLGRLGENEARIARFLIRPILYEFPNVSFTLLNRRKGDADAYPVNGQYIQTSGNYLLWTIQSADLSAVGDGECELIAIDGTTVVKDVIFQTEVLRALDGSGTPPEPWESWQEQVAEDAAKAEAAVEHYPKIEDGFWYVWDAENEEWADTGVKAEGKDGKDGAPGQDGKDGKDGKDGQDGAPGADGKDGKDGQDGSDGAPGADGFSPTATVTKSGKVATISITDKNGTTSETVRDGEDGDPTTIIDDTAGSGDTGKVWSADKTSGEVSSIKSAIHSLDESIAPVESTATATAAHAVGELFMMGETLMVALSAIAVGDTITTEGVTPNAAATTLSAKMIKDVQINGTSILSQGVANVPLATDIAFGVIKLAGSQTGIQRDSSGYPKISAAGSTYIKSGGEYYRPIVPAYQHESAFFGLAKAASADMASLSSVTVGQYPEAQKAAIQKMLGIYEAPWELIREDTVTQATQTDSFVEVDGNGNSFELTDLILMVEMPMQEVQSQIKGYIIFYDGQNEVISSTYINKLQNANDTANGAYVFIQNNNGLVTCITRTISQNSNAQAFYMKYYEGFVYGNGKDCGIVLSSSFKVTKFKIPGVIGTVHYKLYGKRKWAT